MIAAAVPLAAAIGLGSALARMTRPNLAPASRSAPDLDRTTVIELGGGGVISDRDYRVTDVPLRGFWSYYAELLGIEPKGAVR